MARLPFGVQLSGETIKIESMDGDLFVEQVSLERHAVELRRQFRKPVGRFFQLGLQRRDGRLIYFARRGTLYGALSKVGFPVFDRKTMSLVLLMNVPVVSNGLRSKCTGVVPLSLSALDAALLIS